MRSDLPVTAADVLAASAAIGNRLHRTPTLTSATLGASFGGRAYLKAELLQRTGSFKPRGVLAKLASLAPEEKARGVVAISAGNHAGAMAYASALEGLDCLLVMWEGASAQKIAATRRYGAAVDLEAGGPAEAWERLGEVERSTGRTFVHPFDDPTVIAGQGTVGLEIVEDRPDVDAVVVPVGGGGLVSGVAVAAKAAFPDVRVVAVEPDGSRALNAALEAGRPVPVTPDSIADGLSAPFAGERCVAICRRLVDELITVTESEIRAAFRFLYERAKLAVEPAGAVGVAAGLAGKIEGADGATVVFVVSGGNVASQTASAILGFDEG